MSRSATIGVRQASPADRWISRAAVATVAALAALAGAISYSHMRQLAQQHGQAGWHAHAFPLSVDGLEIVASLVLLADHRTGRRPGWLPWAAVITGTAGSLAANVATAGPGTAARIIAGWPALALLIAVKLLTGMLNRPAASRPLARPGPDSHAQSSSRLRPATRPSHQPRTASRGSNPARRPARPSTRRPTPEEVPADALASAIADLLPIARAAWDELHQTGRPLTRDALAAQLRQVGYPLRNSRLTPLLQALRSEATPPPQTSIQAAGANRASPNVRTPRRQAQPTRPIPDRGNQRRAERGTPPPAEGHPPTHPANASTNATTGPTRLLTRSTTLYRP